MIIIRRNVKIWNCNLKSAPKFKTVS